MDEHTNKTGQGRRADHAPEPYTPEPGAIITLAGHVPTEGWQVRRYSSDAWAAPDLIGDAIVEARPIPKPPLMVEIPRDVAEALFLRPLWYGSVAAPLAIAVKAALAAESES